MMKKRIDVILIAIFILGSLPIIAHAQGRRGPPLVIKPLEIEFDSSAEHYAWLLEQSNGGTQHTIDSIPQWPGLWQTGGSTVSSSFVENSEIKEGVLTPAYEQAYRERRAEIAETGEQKFDRLALCEPPGYPRHLGEPYTREFINLPHQSWQLNDVFNENRRVYIGKEHSNLAATHFWLGDTVGFWDGNKLITHTVDVLPVDYFRNQPLTSNQFEGVEVWEMVDLPDGSQRLEVQVTFYDSYSLQKPLNVVYAYVPATNLIDAGVRIRYWECATTNNSYLSEDGTTQFRLPGEPGYKDPRGFTLYPEVPGQSRDPQKNSN